MATKQQLTRRAVLAAIPATLLLPQVALALTPAQGEALVKKMVADITKVINSGKSEAAILRDFEGIFKRYADVPTIARFSLGPAARTASSSELRSYTTAFSGYIARKYGKRFREFIGGEIVVNGAKTQRNMVVVDATAKLRGKSPVSVDFQLSDRSGSAKAFNVIIEGINMLTTERTEIGALLDQQGGSVSKLTAKLKTL